MLNFLYLTLNKFCFSRPSVQYIQPKILNLYFKNSKNPKYQFLNIKDVTSFALEIATENYNNEKIYILVARFIKDKQENVIDIAEFDNKKDAEDALNILKVKLFSPEKKILKISFFLLFLTLIWALFVDISLQNFSRTKILYSSNSISKIDVQDKNLPNPNLAILNDIQTQELLRQSMLNSQNQAQAQEVQPQQKEATATDFLINALK